MKFLQVRIVLALFAITVASCAMAMMQRNLVFRPGQQRAVQDYSIKQLIDQNQIPKDVPSSTSDALFEIDDLEKDLPQLVSACQECTTIQSFDQQLRDQQLRVLQKSSEICDPALVLGVDCAKSEVKK